MEIAHYTLENCGKATGLVVVIDVLRAFSTAGYAFAAGAEDIQLVSSVEQAFKLREKIKNSLIMGEVDGLPVEGFDYGNSPPQFDGMDLSGLHLIQRTTSGTQGVVQSRTADILLAASFCNAGATMRFIRQESPQKVSFVITGSRPGGWGDEDQSCADYIAACINGDPVNPQPFLRRVADSTPGRLFQDPEYLQYPYKDLEYCLELDRFDFIMPVHRTAGHLLMQCSTL